LAVIILLVLVIWPYCKFDSRAPSSPTTPLSLGKAIKMMNGAHFYGNTPKGETYTLHSEKIMQMTSHDFSLESISIILKNLENKEISIKANEGSANIHDKKMNLSKGINITLSDGSILQTSSAFLNLENGSAIGEETVQGEGPLGTLQAGGFEIEEKGKTIRFTKHVKLCLSKNAFKKEIVAP
jgi:lipopolysaccharide export system protein LptC